MTVIKFVDRIEEQQRLKKALGRKRVSLTGKCGLALPGFLIIASRLSIPMPPGRPPIYM
jgi:hypothetical protein